MDFVYRCNRCGKLVYEYQIAYCSHRCKSCGSSKFEPAIQDLTSFGKWYCNLRNKFGMWRNEKIEDIGF